MKVNQPGFIHCHDGDAGKDEWLTPPSIIESLGEFDLDPSAPINRPWPTAKNHFTINDNGLLQDWFGRVWLNPPYGKQLDAWIQKMAMHNNGIALTFARTDTNTFHNFVFPVADSILFIKQRLKFFHVTGKEGSFNGGAPSVLIGYGESNSDALAECGIKGKHLLINRIGVIVVGIEKTWKAIVRMALVNLNNEASLDRLYDEVAAIAPNKVENNVFYKEKVRQQLQLHFSRVKKGHYKLAA